MTATPERYRRLEDALASHGRLWELHDVLTDEEFVRNPALHQQYLDALCDSWLGQRQRRATRSDKGTFRLEPKPWCYGFDCARCGEKFYANRCDAAYCSNACRQRSYRQREAR